MQILGIKNTKSVDRVQKKLNRPNGVSNFSLNASEDISNTFDLTEISPSCSLTNILSLNSINDLDSFESPKIVYQKAQYLLNQLNNFLEATISLDENSKLKYLNELSSNLQLNRNSSHEKDIEDILNAIKLRVAVELAKYSR